jgi:hypothetical protein
MTGTLHHSFRLSLQQTSTRLNTPSLRPFRSGQMAHCGLPYAIVSAPPSHSSGWQKRKYFSSMVLQRKRLGTKHHALVQMLYGGQERSFFTMLWR